MVLAAADSVRQRDDAPSLPAGHGVHDVLAPATPEQSPSPGNHQPGNGGASPRVEGCASRGASDTEGYGDEDDAMIVASQNGASAEPSKAEGTRVVDSAIDIAAMPAHPVALIAVARPESFLCGGCGETQPLGVNAGASHKCKLPACGKDLHSYVLCEKVWMPLEGIYFCTEVCLAKYNNGVAAGDLQGTAVPRRWRQGVGNESPPLPAEALDAAAAAAAAIHRVGGLLGSVVAVGGSAVVAGGAPVARDADDLPLALKHNSTVQVRVEGKMYNGRCCDAACDGGTTIAFADGDWRHLPRLDAIAALERGDIVAASPVEDDTVGNVEGFLFTAGALGRPPRVGGALVGRHRHECYGLDTFYRTHYLCLRSFEPDEPTADNAPRTRSKRAKPATLDRQGLRTFRFGDIVYETSPAPDTPAAAAAVAGIVIQHAERNPDTNKMSQSRRVLLLKELPVNDSAIPFFAGSWKKWERRALQDSVTSGAGAGEDIDIDDANAVVEALTKLDQGVLDG